MALCKMEVSFWELKWDLRVEFMTKSMKSSYLNFLNAICCL
jgi:hypothetical protein